MQGEDKTATCYEVELGVKEEGCLRRWELVHRERRSCTDSERREGKQGLEYPDLHE